MAFENLFIRIKRSLGGIQLDTILVEDHTSDVTITKNPVEAGADLTDHAIIQPKLLFIRGAVSDTPLGLAAFGQLIDSITGLFGTSTENNLTRSQQAYDAMIRLQENREPIEVVTGLKVYTDMLITNVFTSQDKDSSRIVFLNIALEEIIITESATVDLTEQDVDESVKKTATPTVERGREEPIEPTESENRSILKTITGWF